ncbi:branched-chain amino acid ABC transporter permease [Herbaspirillum sp. RTI4]|uniref:branched-chain amino acid ABC transporter permease n=1 Tax=Herbaspirillum sp. RTI4 TaxID=3048640 RepID=UPI002AB3CF21|nr:branched-chain amino acid ABC transporter permease [Herbaspirillum sp. RTI4]MDY7578844.1 branched-chain amino acid ABC transporter permease [Herbaspirillum sp. RTI4]MEA9982698.1 branched-chain amino acid ABC transporter permease [Herbaspirillum sp. RTI4]
MLIAPWIWSDGTALSLLSQMATLMLLGLSYNMLLGQGGMLSFGHAVYSGMGAFAAIYALQAIGAGSLPLPVTLLPLVGGVAGLLCGALFGYLTTRLGGTTFAMLTLGIGELVAAFAAMLPDYFGGESGISADRVTGSGWQGLNFGVTYGPQIEVYYLIAAWLFLCGAAMYGFTLTPLGRLLKAVRDNPERAEFIGCDPRRVRYLTLMLSAFFAGIAGALSAINFEIVSVENLSSLRSGALLVLTVIGGSGHFFGPVLGAAISIGFSGWLATRSNAWQLYMGLFFMLAVMFAPGGVAGAVASLVAVCRDGGWRRLWRPIFCVAMAALCVTAAGVMLIELLYRWRYGAADTGLPMSVAPMALMACIVALLVSCAALAFLWRWLQRCRDVRS